MAGSDMSAKRERAVWGPAEENVLLELFRQARNDPEVRSTRGVKSRGWLSIVAELNRRCNRNFDKDQLKSKYARLIQEYELFKAVGGLLTADKNPLDDKDWDRLIRERPKSAPQLRQFREHGFAHADICSRIVGDAEDSGHTAPLPPPPSDTDESAMGKRDREETPDANKAHTEFKRERASWAVTEEKMLLFLYLSARNNADMSSGKSLKARGWLNVVSELNNYCKTQFDKDQCKSKYSRLMQDYDHFKKVTGFTGAGPAPQSDADWDKLLKERPEFTNDLKHLKSKGFPHVETCGVITGDVPPSGSATPSQSDFMDAAAHQFVGVSNISTGAAANALPFLLPATAQAPSSSQSEATEAAGVLLSGAAAASASAGPGFFTPELRENLNAFLKTATTYLTMLIDERNKQ